LRAFLLILFLCPSFHLHHPFSSISLPNPPVSQDSSSLQTFAYLEATKKDFQILAPLSAVESPKFQTKYHLLDLTPQESHPSF